MQFIESKIQKDLNLLDRYKVFCTFVFSYIHSENFLDSVYIDSDSRLNPFELQIVVKLYNIFFYGKNLLGGIPYFFL